MKTTALYQEHCRLGGKIVPFAGWQMPLHYGSQKNEHHQVRSSCGMFDVSHMTVIDLSGDDRLRFLSRVFANSMDKIDNDQAIYGTFLNDLGGIIDDLIIYRFDHFCRIVVNASTREKVLNWLNQQKVALNCSIELQYREDLAIVAIQGPKACEKLRQLTAILLPSMLEYLVDYRFFKASFFQEWDAVVGFTGYTGEQGCELILPHEKACAIWKALIEIDVHPIGLAARDTLRLEAGLNLYGQDMTEADSPLTSRLKWTVTMNDDRDFIGKQALLKQIEAGIASHLVPLAIQDSSAIMRTGHEVFFEDQLVGVVTSGTYSPSLGYSIGFARVKSPLATSYEINIRNKRVLAQVVKTPFIKK